jgi:hypothetical protein
VIFQAVLATGGDEEAGVGFINASETVINSET